MNIGNSIHMLNVSAIIPYDEGLSIRGFQATQLQLEFQTTNKGRWAMYIWNYEVVAPKKVEYEKTNNPQVAILYQPASSSSSSGFEYEVQEFTSRNVKTIREEPTGWWRLSRKFFVMHPKAFDVKFVLLKNMLIRTMTYLNKLPWRVKEFMLNKESFEEVFEAREGEDETFDGMEIY
ncbi:hypothetical protein L1887_19991 [Cichorium endivia]|nr:hypothetical protein L1887_19991 [Cichorium endivia]